MFASKDTLLTRPSGYNIARSVRLRSSASGYFSRTPSASSRTTWTWTAWVKRGKLGSAQALFSAGTGTAEFRLTFTSSDTIEIYEYTSPSYNWQKITTAVYRDPSAWYQIQLVYDTTNGTAGDRVKLYVNSVQVTSFGTNTNPIPSFSGYVNSAVAHGIGSFSTGGSYLDGYLTEINFIDGQALTPSSFGETNAVTGVWQPKKYAGTYGTNGFYLNFSDNSNNTAATIGKDYSGNGNNWTPNNVQTYDSVPDTPSNNFCVMNPLYNGGSGTAWLDGNLKVNVSSTQSGITASTFAVSSGKWYWEIVASPSSPPSLCVGIIKTSFTPIGDIFLGYQSEGYGYYSYDGKKVNNSSFSSYGSSWEGAQFVIGIALDMDAGTIVFYRNNVSQGTAFSSLSGLFTFAASDGGLVGTTFYVNFGADSSFAGQMTAQTNTDANGLGNFFYAVPSGYLALCTQNLPASTITNGAAYMAATLYSGTGGTISPTNTVNSVSFQPDFVWIKVRTTTYNHNLFDSVRGVQNVLNSNATYSENVSGAGDLTAFNSNGFTVRQTANYELSNASATYVAWQWKAGTTSSSNTNGSITSTVSAGATQGFSVVTYTGTGANATVGHGLGVAPQMIIIKGRDTGYDWRTYHASVGNTSALFLNTTSGSVASSTYWNNTSPTSSVFSVGSNAGMNGSTNTYVAYCFAAVAGYSAFGSYTGNGSSDGPFIYTGFRPRFVLWKRITTAGGHWGVIDSGRNTYNLANLSILANAADGDATNVQVLDLLSNGFKIRTSDGGQNLNADSFIYMAFAENPFRNALAR